MGFCIRHNEVQTNYLCMKYNEYMCDTCIKCKDPEIYCKFRENCTIAYIDKERRRETD